MRSLPLFVLLIAASAMTLACSANAEEPPGATQASAVLIAEHPTLTPEAEPTVEPSPDRTSTGPEREGISGLIEAMHIDGDRLISIVVRDDQGRHHSYKIMDPEELNVSVEHLKLHQETDDPVTLVLTEVAGNKVVERITD